MLPPTAPLEELPMPELEPDVLPGLLVLGLVVEELEPGLDRLPPALELEPARARASQSCFAMPVSETQSLALPEPLVLEPRLPEAPLDVLPAVLGEVVLLELELGLVLLPVLGLVVLGVDGLVVEGLVVLGLVVDDPPIEPLELEVCATETPAAPRNAAATAAQRSLLVIVSLL